MPARHTDVTTVGYGVSGVLPIGGRTHRIVVAGYREHQHGNPALFMAKIRLGQGGTASAISVLQRRDETMQLARTVSG